MDTKAKSVVTPALTADERQKQAVWFAKSVFAWREGPHLGIKGPGTPPVFVSPADLPRLAELIALPPKPPECPHGKMPGDCASCGTVAGPGQ